jgi:hypothetical protein
MTPGRVTLALMLISIMGMPCVYIAWCGWMLLRKVPKPPYLSYFFLFGVVGGWALAFAMSPSGLAASSIVFLLFLAPVGTLVGAASVWARRSLSWYHRVALYLSLGYPATVLVGFLGVAIPNIWAR